MFWITLEISNPKITLITTYHGWLKKLIALKFEAQNQATTLLSDAFLRTQGLRFFTYNSSPP